MSDGRFEPDRAYYIPAHHYGPCPQEDARDTLQEAVEVIAAKRAAGDNTRYVIERREVIASGGGVTDQPTARFTADGKRPAEFDRVAEGLMDCARRLGQDVYLNALDIRTGAADGESRLGYARGALKHLQAFTIVLERAIDEASAELVRYEAEREART